MEDSGIDSDPKTNTQAEDENLFLGSDSSCGSTQTSQIFSTTKHLQKKLEARIEQAKRIQRNSDYMKLPDHDNDACDNNSGIGLIPIERLPIPQKRKKNAPLVEFWQSDSESEDELTLFPMPRSKDSSKHKQDLTDTFSIEELSEASEDSLDLGSAESSHPHTKTYAPTGCFSCQCHIL